MKHAAAIGLLVIFHLLGNEPSRAVAATRYAGDPLLLGAGARSLGMGGAFVALSDDATAVYWNPAGLSRLARSEAQVQHTEQFGGTVNYDLFAVSTPSAVGGFGIGLVRLGVDGIKLTTLEDPTRPPGPDNRPVVSRVVGTSDYDLYLAYGRTLRPGLSAGASLKLIWRNLSAGSGSGYGLDMGLLYSPRPGFSLALTLRNLTRTRVVFDTGSTDRISPSLLLGAACTRAVSWMRGSLTGSVSVDLGEQKSSLGNAQGFHAGIEYWFRKQLAFRIGAQDAHFTAGAGVRLYRRLGFDLAFLEDSELDNTYRISASVYF